MQFDNVNCRFVTKDRAAELIGYSVRAIDGKIFRGDWCEGVQYVRAPDKRILIDLKGVESWAAK